MARGVVAVFEVVFFFVADLATFSSHEMQLQVVTEDPIETHEKARCEWLSITTEHL